MLKPIKIPAGWRATEFNRAARAAVLAKDSATLHLLAGELAARQLSWRRGPKCPTARRAPAGDLADDMLSAGKVAGATYAAAYRKGKFYEHCGKAIANAMDEYRRAAGHNVASTWKGGYDTHTRKFSSQLPHTLPALQEAMENNEPASEAPESTHADERDQRDADREAYAEYARARGLELQGESRGDQGKANIATGAAMLEAGAERTSHDGGHADDVRLNPKDDGETGYGVEGATRGLWTGSVTVDNRTLAKDEAWWLLTTMERALLEAVEKAGRYSKRDNEYVRPGVGVHAQRLAQNIRAAAAHYKTLTDEVLVQIEAGIPLPERDAAGRVLADPTALTAEELAQVPPPSEPRAYDPTGTPDGRGVVSAAWPTKEPGRKITGARSWVRVRVSLRPGSMFGVTYQGLSWAEHKRLTRDWKPGTLFEPGGRLWQKWQENLHRIAGNGWDAPLIVTRTVRSLLDEV